MLTKEEKKVINQQFWNGFKLFMRGIPSANGKRMNWLNYPTDVKILFLRLEANTRYARVSFDIQAKDSGVRSIIWEQMEELKAVLTNAMQGDSGTWEFEYSNSSVSSYSTIHWELDNVNYLREKDHEVIYSFFKEKLIGFDDFYQNFKDILILLIK